MKQKIFSQYSAIKLQCASQSFMYKLKIDNSEKNALMENCISAATIYSVQTLFKHKKA